MDENTRFRIRAHVIELRGGAIVREVWYDGWTKFINVCGALCGGDAAAFDEACEEFERTGWIRMERRANG